MSATTAGEGATVAPSPGTPTKQQRLRNMADEIERANREEPGSVGAAIVRISLYRSVANDLDRLDDHVADNARLRAAIESGGGVSTIRKVATNVRTGDFNSAMCSTLADWMERVADAVEVQP